jgi:hypothetical protein
VCVYIYNKENRIAEKSREGETKGDRIEVERRGKKREEKRSRRRGEENRKRGEKKRGQER